MNFNGKTHQGMLRSFGETGFITNGDMLLNLIFLEDISPEGDMHEALEVAACGNNLE